MACNGEYQSYVHHFKLAISNLRSIQINEFDARKASIVNEARGHMELSSTDLSSSTSHASSAKSNVEDFAINTIQSRKSVSPTPGRRSYIYSVNLSATPSPDIIVKGITFPLVSNRSNVKCGN